ncbi:TPA: helix-turn-helix domain-containing protein, partial [Streptococcus pneumoniae]
MSVKNELLYLIEHKENAPLELMGHLYLLLSNLIGTSINKKEKSGNNMLEFYLHEARIFIEQNYHRDISAEDVAHVCNLSRVYLSKIFKNKFNTTLQEFIIQFRMSKAQELLKTTDYSVTKISEMVGYQNAFNFSRAFKKITGISPRDWRIKNSII